MRASKLTGLLVAVVAGTGGCSYRSTTPRSPEAIDGGGSTREAGPATADGSSPDRPAAADADPAVLPCADNLHRCNDRCVPNDQEACGTTCERCQAPFGGSSSCDGARCVPTCIGSRYHCPDSQTCLTVDQPCGVTGCGPGYRRCPDGLCRRMEDVNHCGPGCAGCPPSPMPGGFATCRDGRCAYGCVGSVCPDRCIFPQGMCVAIYEESTRTCFYDLCRDPPALCDGPAEARSTLKPVNTIDELLRDCVADFTRMASDLCQNNPNARVRVSRGEVVDIQLAVVTLEPLLGHRVDTRAGTIPCAP